MRDGRLREDLYFRINTVTLRVPPLRERTEDLPLLCAHFLDKFSKRYQKNVKGISPAAYHLLIRFRWPGNVRELENAIERAVVLGSSIEILPEDLPEMVVDSGAGAISLGDNGYHSAVVELKKRLIVEALDRSKGSVTEAARLLKLHPNYLHRLMNNLNLRAE